MQRKFNNPNRVVNLHIGFGMDLEDRIKQATTQAQELRESIQKIKEVNLETSLATFTKDLSKIEKCAIKCRKVLKGHQGKIFALQWSEDKTHLTSVSQDSRLLVWEGLTTNKTTVVPLKCPWMMSCTQSPSGNFVAAAGLDNICSVFNVLSADFPPKPCRELSGHSAFISCCRFLNDRQVITSSADTTCILWDLESGSKIKEFIHHEQDVMAVGISPNKEFFVSVSCDKTCCLWSLQTGRVERVFKGHSDDINCVQFFPTGQAFVTGSDDFSCLLFDIRTERDIMKYQSDTVDSAVNSLSLSRSGRLLFTAHDDTACQVWDTLRGEIVGKLGGRNGHTQRVSCVDVSADGYAVATGSWDTNIRIWA